MPLQNIFSGDSKYKGSWFKEHSLSIVLIALLIAQSLAFHFTEVQVWKAEHQAQGLWPQYWLHYWAEWFASVLADTYGALLLVLFSKWFFEKGSAENSKKLQKKRIRRKAGSSLATNYEKA